MERALLVALALGRRAQPCPVEDSLEELRHLAVSAGASVVRTLVQEKDSPDPRYFIGRGKVEELAGELPAMGADVVIFDQDLSPSQQRNLEDAWRLKVVDRTGLILDIFAQRARTREGKLQVELAQLEYLLPHLVGRHSELSRLGGGIGTRGPGEKKLEMDRRRVKQRMTRIGRELERVKRQRSLYRRKRGKATVPVAALVGYTNAGKSTLLHALTGAEVLREDRLFSTLDPTTRRLRLPGGGVALLTDTVGFIRHIPHQLIAAFKSTLEEVLFADLVVHVIDLSREDFEEQARVVREVLAEIGAAGKPVLEVFNKLDLLSDPGLPARMRHRHPGAAFISARLRLGLDSLLASLEEALEATPRPARTSPETVA